MQQAWLFGADLILAQAATGLRADGPDRVVRLSGGGEVTTRAVILATGVAWRRLGVPALEALNGAGVFYGAAGSEARAMRGEDVYVVGAGNSAGQAAVHLAGYAASVTIVTIDERLGEFMSDYLVRKVQATPNISVVLHTEVVDGHGRQRLEGLTLPDRPRLGHVHPDRGRAAHRLAGRGGRARRARLRPDRPRADGRRRPAPGRLAPGAPADAPGDQPARRVRGRRRPLPVDQAGRLGRRRGVDRRPAGPRVPERTALVRPRLASR